MEEPFGGKDEDTGASALREGQGASDVTGQAAWVEPQLRDLGQLALCLCVLILSSLIWDDL